MIFVPIQRKKSLGTSTAELDRTTKSRHNFKKSRQSDKVPGALLKKGYAYIALGEKAQGIVQLQYVVHEHPSSQEASLARQKLQTLGVQR